MAEQLLERNASSPDFAETGSHNQQFRQPEKKEDSYSRDANRKVYQSTQRSFDEQWSEYVEQAYNASYNAAKIESESRNIRKNTDNRSETPHISTTLPLPPAQTFYDSALDKLVQKRDSTIKKEEQIYHSIKYKKGRRLITANRYQKKMPLTEKEAAQRLVTGRKRSVKYATYSTGDSLLFQKTEKRLTKKAYDKKSQKDYRRKYIRDVAVGKAVRTGRLLFDDGSIEDDEDAAAVKRYLKKGARTGRIIVRKSVRDIDKKTNKYTRLKTAIDRENLLNLKIKQRNDRNTYRQELEAIKVMRRRSKQKKRMKQAMIDRKAREGNFFRRTWNNLKIKKKSVEQQARKTKNIVSVAVSVILILTVLLFSNMFLLIFGMSMVQGTAESYTQTIVQADYSDMSECTAYYRKLETDLTEKLMDTDTLEEEIREEYGDDIYEYVYELAEISFDSTTLVAYLGAKYVEFTLADVQPDLDEVFALNYVLHIETKMEYREAANADVKICYITLEKTPLEDIVIGRMTEEQLKQYQIYKMSSGGQQVYGPVMQEDWTNLITSNYGERIHPITGERTFHKGVDIGIPVGTPLYSAVSGTVTDAGNSSTAGNYVRIQNSTGWTVTFMHMDSFIVAAGDVVKQGDFVGYSGNTGRSTGPHLHLEVWDRDKNTVNPIFIIPQNCVRVETEED